MRESLAPPQSSGQAMAARHKSAVGMLRTAGRGDVRVIRGVTPKGVFTRPIGEVVREAIDCLVGSGQVYRRGVNVAIEIEDAGEKRLIGLSADRAAVKTTAGELANLFVCEAAGREGEEPVQYLPPHALVEALLSDPRLRRELPAVERYVRRPVYGKSFRLLGPGYHPAERTLVHGPHVEPLADLAPTPPAGGPPLAEFPLLGQMLCDFPFASTDDFANAVAGMVTAVMPETFTEDGRPVLAATGNQPNLGKTTYVRQLGMLADGTEPTLLPYTSSEEELRKAIGATFRDTQASVLVIDNAKTVSGGPISSGTLELYSASPRIRHRILGTSSMLDVPNDRLWCVTANGAKLSRDLASRAMAVRFQFAGDPATRPLPDDDPVRWVCRNRIGLLGEVAGMVRRWIDRGRPEARANHRFRFWSQTVGGILEVNGISGFLANRKEAAAEYDLGGDELADLAEAALANGGPVGPDKAATAKQWLPTFRAAEVLADRLRLGQDQAAATHVGTWLKAKVSKPAVVVDATGAERQLTLAARKGRARKMYYYFTADDAMQSPGEPSASSEASPAAAPPPTPEPEPPDSDGAGNRLAW